jgi:phage terminase large subunit GpA-like protein
MWERQTSFYEGNSNSRMAFFSGKVPFQRLNSNALKDRLNGVLMREEPGGARMRYPMWLPNWFYVQMCAEERLAGKGWQKPKGGGRNESFDCSYYCLALCAHPDIGLQKIQWDNPDRVPAWARPWDQNALIIAAEEANPLVQKKAPVGDAGKALSACG